MVFIESVLYFLQSHFIMIVELVGLWTMLNIGVHIDKRIINVTRVVIILIFAEAVLWSVENWTQSFEKMSLLRPMLTATIYLIHPAILLTITEMLVPIEKGHMWLLNPMFVSIPILYTSQWTHMVFWISEDNVFYGNGYMQYYPYFLFFIYILVFFVMYISYYTKYSGGIRAGIVYLVAVSIVGVTLNLLYDTETDYSTLLASVVILYYLFLYMQMSRLDSLTKMMNRQCFYYDSKNRRNDITGILSVDMNDLKIINDNYGHEAGDKALMTVADCLMADCDSRKSAYRIGGDEFVILYFGKPDDLITEDINSMKQKLSETEYTCAFGFISIRAVDDFDSAMHEADKAMYRNKAEMKRVTDEKG